MSAGRSIELPPALSAAVEAAAAWRGMSFEAYIQAVVKTAAYLDAELAADIKEGEEDLAAGRFYTQEQMEKLFDVRREERRAA